MIDGIINITQSPAYGEYLSGEQRDTVAGYKNRKIFANIFIRNANIASFRYDIDGAPDTINARAVKQGHLWYPGVCYFELDDAPGTTFALPAVPGGSGYNMYGELADCYAFGMNGDVYHIRLAIRGEDKSRVVTRTPGPYAIAAEGHGAFVRENYMMWPFIHQTIFYSDQIADTMRAMENSRYWLKHPVGLHGTEKERKTWETYRQQVADNVPYVWIYDNELQRNSSNAHASPENMNDATDFTRPASEVIDWFEQQYWRECGIENMGGQIDKKGENLQTAEITHTSDYTSMTTQMLLDTLNEQLDEVHKLPGCENIRYTPRKEARGGDDDIRNISGRASGSLFGDGAPVSE